MTTTEIDRIARKIATRAMTREQVHQTKWRESRGMDERDGRELRSRPSPAHLERAMARAAAKYGWREEREEREEEETI